MDKVVIRITFEAESVDDLKLKIQEYSLAHLGLNLVQLSELRKPIDPPQPTTVPSGQGISGVTKEAILNDGTIRLHNPRFPSRAPHVEEKKKRGRPVGWRKVKQEEMGPDKPPEESAVITEISLEPPKSDGVTKEQVKDAIHKINALKGFQAAVDALSEFGAKHINDVQECHYQDLILHIEEVINGTDPEPDGAA